MFSIFSPVTYVHTEHPADRDQSIYHSDADRSFHQPALDNVHRSNAGDHRLVEDRSSQDDQYDGMFHSKRTYTFSFPNESHNGRSSVCPTISLRHADMGKLSPNMLLCNHER